MPALLRNVLPAVFTAANYILAIVTNYMPGTFFHSNFPMIKTALPITLVCNHPTAAK